MDIDVATTRYVLGNLLKKHQKTACDIHINNKILKFMR